MPVSDIFDNAFFGFARTGTYSSTLAYPVILRSGETGSAVFEEDEVEIAGNRFKRNALLPFSGDSSTEKYLVAGDLVVLKDGPSLLNRSRRFVSTLMEIHSKFGFSKLIYASGIADPYLLPVLVYLGVNIFDDALPRAFASRKLTTGLFGLQEDADANAEQNVQMCDQVVQVLRTAIEKRSLREVVEKYQFSSKAVEMLRILDSDYSQEQQKVFPAFTPFIRSSNELSLQNPLLQLYRDRILKNYSRPSGRDILLILPCSARKPYSRSSSHRRIIDAISEYRRQVHELIVTSPLGLVPREIEELFPAAFYDIPVIGRWYEDEKVMIKEMLAAYLRKNRYRKVVAFVSEDLGFIGKVLPEEAIIITGSSRSEEDLRHLRSLIAGDFDPQKKTPSGSDRLESFFSMAKFQYGDWIMDYISECRLIRSYGQEMLSKSGKVVMVFNPYIGKITITKEIAPAFLENGKHVVYIDDFKPTANVYAVGVLSTSEDVRQEDEVVVAYDKEVRGVGIAKMPSAAMVNLKKGIAVKMRN